MTKAAFAALRMAAPMMAILLLSGGNARAEDDSLVIWTPEKIAERAYKLRVGARAPVRVDVSAGLDLAIAGQAGCKVDEPTEPARLWAEVGAEGVGDTYRRLTAGFNALTGGTSAGVGTTRTFMVTPRIDFVSERSVYVGYETYHGYLGSVGAVQTAKIALPGAGTSLAASGTAMTGDTRFATSLSIEQKLVSDHLSLRAAITKADAGPIGSLGANLAFDW